MACRPLGREQINMKVRTGVVDHSVSEKGERGGSPSPVSAGMPQVELACRPQGRLRW
jgi:hypothetical protein